MVSRTTALALGSHIWRILLVYMRSLSVIDGVTLMYLNSENVAEMGTVCDMPLRQSFTRLFLKNTFSLAVSEFWKRPL